jgi:UDP-N-acetyl-D-galactosamine dehydrogenase
MGAYVANRVVKLMIHKGHRIQGANVLILGITFKENCPDIRNSKVVGVIRELREFGCNVRVYDPWADADEVQHEYGLELSPRPNGDQKAATDAVVLAVAHNEFRNLDMTRFNKDNVVVFDIKGFLSKSAVDGRL